MFLSLATIQNLEPLFAQQVGIVSLTLLLCLRHFTHWELLVVEFPLKELMELVSVDLDLSLTMLVRWEAGSGSVVGRKGQSKWIEQQVGRRAKTLLPHKLPSGGFQKWGPRGSFLKNSQWS